MDDVVNEIASGLLFGAVGVVLLAIGFFMIDLLTPGKLAHLICHDRNKPAAIVTSAGLAAIGAIVTVAIASADGSLGDGLAETAVYGGVGIIMQGVAFIVVDLITPGRLGDLVVDDEGEQPVVWVTATAMLAAGAIVAASIS